MSQEQRTWKNNRQPVALSIFSTLGRPGILVALSFALIVASCSKKQKAVEEKEIKPRDNEPAKQTATAELRKPMVMNAQPIISPGHLPPNTRVPQLTGITPDLRRLLEQPLPPVQPAPVKAFTGASPAQLPTTPVHTPDQSNQARLNALEEMFRQRDATSRASNPGSTPANSVSIYSKDPIAPAKTKP